MDNSSKGPTSLHVLFRERKSSGNEVLEETDSNNHSTPSLVAYMIIISNSNPKHRTFAFGDHYMTLTVTALVACFNMADRPKRMSRAPKRFVTISVRTALQMFVEWKNDQRSTKICKK